MLLNANQWTGESEGGFDCCYNVVTAAHSRARWIRCSLLCVVARYVTKHKCVFPLMRTEVELLGRPRRTWLGQQMIWSGFIQRLRWKGGDSENDADKRFSKMCWIERKKMVVLLAASGRWEGLCVCVYVLCCSCVAPRFDCAPQTALLYQIRPQGVSSKPGSSPRPFYSATDMETDFHQENKTKQTFVVSR